jgi:hypothetical protein
MLVIAAAAGLRVTVGMVPVTILSCVLGLLLLASIFLSEPRRKYILELTRELTKLIRTIITPPAIPRR